MLTIEQAAHRVRDGFRDAGAPELELTQTIERAFGWVFIAVDKGAEGEAERGVPRNPIIFVNKYNGQVLFTSTAFFVETCIDNYEAVLKVLGNEWCLTLRAPTPRGFNPLSFKHGILRRKLEALGLCELPVPPLHEPRGRPGEVLF